MDKNKRVVIVDYNHMAHTYMNSNFRLSHTVVYKGEAKTIDTTVQTGTIKAIHRWSNGGKYPTAVCFDSPVPARKAYFAKAFDMGVDSDKAYKGGRASMPGEMYDAIEMVKDYLMKSGVSCFKGEGYEADDLIKACINSAIETYPDHYIDVITNDADLLPLVDDRVSVFLRSKKGTWAEFPAIEKQYYIQVTPSNFQEVVEGLSAYKNFFIPYNSLLLHKLLRGDSSDNIPGVKKLFPPTKYNKIIQSMLDNGVDFSKLFRYGDSIETKVYIETQEVAPKDETQGVALRYDDPEELNNLVETLCWYIEDEAVMEHVRRMYRGMNLNQAYVVGSLVRKPAKLASPMVSFNETELQSKVIDLGINLKLKY